MKKYLFGIMAIAMAIGFSAFTTKGVKKNQTPEYLFSYVAPGGTDFSQGAVADPENWALIDEDYQSTDETCASLNVERACELVVSSENVVDEKIAITIETESGSSGYAVTAGNGILHAFNDVE